MNGIVISGNVWKRFMEVAALLYLLDPVRGEPTAYGLDQDPHEIGAHRERLLKRKFLDSFALICAVTKDGDSVSAACIEEGRPEGTIVRVASNSGVSDATLSQLREIVTTLNEIATGGVNVSTREAEILLKIIQLDIRKIRHYLEFIQNAPSVFDMPISAIENHIKVCLSQFMQPLVEEFLGWFQHIFAIRSLPKDAEPPALIAHVLWAQKAKRYYHECLNASFSTADKVLHPWVHRVFKLGRYGVACRALVQLAVELPALFSPMMVEKLAAPAKIRYSYTSDTPLKSVLRRVAKHKSEEFQPQLARIWNTGDAEGLLRRLCCRDLAVHAEMQLVNFYDHNQLCKPTYRFVGVSKKSCYLCYMFLSTHPESFHVSSCHQKLYLSWIPSPADDSKIYKRYKTMITELSKIMEATARQDLETRIGILRSPVPADSTAGVSLGGLTNRTTPNTRSYMDAMPQEEFIANGEETTEVSQPFIYPAEVGSVTTPMVETETTSSHETSLSSTSGTSRMYESSKPVPAMVFHIMRIGNAAKQDIISISDILDPFTSSPSWMKLIEYMKVDEGHGLGFDENSEFLMVNKTIRVANERQFLACLQYLRNSDTLNSEVLILEGDEDGEQNYPHSLRMIVHACEVTLVLGQQKVKRGESLVEDFDVDEALIVILLGLIETAAQDFPR